MIVNPDIQNQLAQLVKTSATQLLEVAQDVAQTPQWVPGERLPAYILASLPNGRFQVQIQDQVLDMNLPRNSEPGQKIELTFISASPRMTFALTNDLAQALPSNSGVSLSETAKFLGALLQKGNLDKAPMAANGAVPILNGAPPAATQDFAVALRNAVSQSGLFYESHQAQWVSGERSFSSLMQEPQAKLPLNSATITSTSNSATIDIAKSSVDSIQNQAVNNMGREAVHPLAAPIVHQQLEALDTRQIVWQGQVWPGQNMDWRIEEDDARQAEAYEDEAPRWRTRLHLDLPGLGGVTARLAIDHNGVRVEMLAERGDSASLLRGEVAQLADSMEASGLKVAGLAVKQNG